jgi:selenocysteine-specific elongation factor
VKEVIAGTAGHIDHGKTALVRALTGIDADRLAEEKRRGITIDIGFAHLQLTPSIRVGFVDVPGHERFVKNMLAGVSGIDLVLFVVAADESIMPQTREHFEICRLLAIPRGIVVLTKADLVDGDLLELVRLEVDEFVKGSFLEGAPAVAVSSTTGAGLRDLQAALERVAAEVPSKEGEHPFRLPIDRAFSMKGFGAVVTGTLISGSVAKEQEVELHPAGRKLRVRGVQVYGSPAARAVAGERTALNLADIEPVELARGMVLADPGRFRDTDRADVSLELLASAKPLKHRAPVHFHAGAAEIEAEIRLAPGAGPMKPGSTGFARIVLRDPALLVPGDHFIIRMFSPVVTIGGGVVIDSAPPRRLDPARLAALARGSLEQRAALRIRESKFGLTAAELASVLGSTERAVEAATTNTPRAGRFLVDAAWFHAARGRIVERVRDFHRANPLLPGMPRQDLRGRDLTACPAPVFDALVAHGTELIAEGDTVRLAAHRTALRQDEQAARAAIETAFEAAGLAVPGVAETLAKSGVETARARSLLQMLIREKRLVRVTEDLVFHASAIETLRGLVANHRGARFNVATFKDWTGISRKYAIPLLEYLDREKVTRRDGDERVVL